MGLNCLPVETRSLLLRHFDPEDAPVVFALSQEESWRTWLPSQAYGDQAHALSVVAFLVGQYSAPGDPRHGPYVLAIAHRADRVLIGHVGFSPLGDEVEIGFSMAQDYQGKGLATEAVVAATRWAFEAFGLDRIVAVTSLLNVASQRTLVRAGFAYQGKKGMNFQGAEQDVSVYGLSRPGGG